MTRKTITGRANRNESGLALVEFAFVMVLFVMLLWGIISFGYAWSLKEQMYHAAQEGIRTALVTPTPAGATDDKDKWDAAQSSVKDKLRAMLGNDVDDVSFVGIDDTTSPNRTPVGTPSTNPTYGPCKTSSGGDEPGTKCITLKIIYHWKDHPKIAPLPGIFAFFPDDITATVTGKVS